MLASIRIRRSQTEKIFLLSGWPLLCTINYPKRFFAEAQDAFYAISTVQYLLKKNLLHLKFVHLVTTKNNELPKGISKLNCINLFSKRLRYNNN